MTYGQLKAIMTNIAALSSAPDDAWPVQFINPPQATVHEGDLLDIVPVLSVGGFTVAVGSGSSETSVGNKIVLEADL
jgi:hypothetical protein